MENTYLVILEASQKQAFIFGHKRLQNNIIASDVIRYITNAAFFKTIPDCVFSEEENLVYDGGGHTILEFDSEKEAKDFIGKITLAVLRQFPEIELFAKISEYDANLKPSENENLLIQKLEIKKARRRASFHQGAFGIEASAREEKRDEMEQVLSGYKEKTKPVKLRNFIDTAKFNLAYEFENLGGKKNESNFIAVVHIDGNMMGRRVAALSEEIDDTGWEDYKERKRAFSEAIDSDFKEAFARMVNVVEENMPFLQEKLDLKDAQKLYFPVRPIILAGDDVCFVTEGRIGIECACIFMEELAKKMNAVDSSNYSACAGVAIVHQKYPFYRAYELAEELCSNAKKYISQLASQEGPDAGVANVCAIDWHIEYGEMNSSLSEIRSQYRIENKGYNGEEKEKHLERRPYWVCGDNLLTSKDPLRSYESFRKLITSLQSEDIAAKSKIKGMRSVLKESEQAAEHFVAYQRIDNLVWKSRDAADVAGKKLFDELYDGKEYSALFDVIEMMDTFIPMERSCK